jgi:hypothetical protein
VKEIDFAPEWDGHTANDVGRLLSLTCVEALGSVEELAEMVKAKTEGRLVELLCNVGDKVYCHDGNEWNVYHIELFDGTTVYRLKHGDKGYFAVTTEEFNKKWWLTRAEAENALERQAAHE